MKLFLLIGALCIAGAARAEDAPKPAADRPVRVGASHRVDVIAPGERVETVLDRMRAARNPTTAPAVQPAQRPVRGPEGGREHDGHGPPPGAPPRAPGGAPPGPASGGPPSERPHR